MPISDPEHALLDRLRRGDAAAVTELVETFGARIEQIAFRRLRNREDAEEVTQDVLLKVVRAIDTFRGDAALGSWIHRIAFNAAVSHARTRARRHVEASRDAQEFWPGDAWHAARGPRQAPDWSSLGDEAVLRRQVRERMRQELAALPAIYRWPVELRDVHGLSTAEAGQALGLTAQAVKSRLHRGRAILRPRLAEFRGGLSMHRHSRGRGSALAAAGDRA